MHQCHAAILLGGSHLGPPKQTLLHFSVQPPHRAAAVGHVAQQALAGLDELHQVGDGPHVVGRGSSSAPDCSEGYRSRHRGALILVRALAEENSGKALFRYSTVEGGK